MSPPHLRFSQLSITSKMQTSPSSRLEQSSGQGISHNNPTQTSNRNSARPSPSQSSVQEEEEDSNVEEETDESEDEEDEDTQASGNHQLFALDHCRQHEQTFAFQIASADVKTYSIRINTQASAGPVCSCEEEGTCQHIRWLLEQLEDGIEPDIDPSLSPQERLHRTGLDNICHTLRWELREFHDDGPAENEYQLVKMLDANSSSSASIVPPPSQGTRQRLELRLFDVRDIMATLSHHEVVETYRPDIFDNGGRGTLDYTVVPRDLEASLARMLVHNDRIFHQFKSFVPPNVRAEEYFLKMVYKAKFTCEQLDHYAAHGPGSTGQIHDVIWCGKQLVEIIDSIHKNIGKRELSAQSREVGAKALIDILQFVIQKNKDVYSEPMSWARRRPHGERNIDRNLYMRLIGTASPDNPAKGTFVLNALQALPEALRFVDELEGILVLLTVQPGYRPPPLYTNKLRDIIFRLKGRNSPGASSSGKRPASSMDRQAKRMK
ncbi:hypothetical protein HYFRA_00013192 [Hymenoscyphus fraxineus]|uniref:SWIM-type domain-containing protein n=1 Tax=Hymenoscyphus fraxineus TaxID=746836 RepID=A0A9N9PMT4_9HELO|nr:hypothetical protein HYFRA_00013192 [Hymenoscyphus fraxineus]